MKPNKLFTATIPTALALAFLSVPATMSAAVFTLGNVSGTPGSDVTVPLTTSGFTRTDWSGAEFTVTWEPSVLTYKSHSTPLFSGALFEPSTGGFSWSTGGQTTVPNGSTIFQVTFTIASTASVGSYEVGFHQDYPPLVVFDDLSTETPLTTAGSIEAVPEPVNYALMLFACAFAGFSGIRRMIHRRQSTC